MQKSKRMFSYVVKLMILAVCTLLVDGNRLYYAISTTHGCPEHYDCCAITSCSAAWTSLRAGQPPKVCGWLNRSPLVCCPQYDQESQYLDEEPLYVPAQPHYILRAPLIQEELPPPAVAILPTVRYVPSAGYLLPQARIPVVGYLPSNEGRIAFAGNILPNGRRLSFSEKRLPYSDKGLPSNDRRLSFSEKRLPFVDRWIPMSEKRLPPVRQDTPLDANLPSSRNQSLPTGEETSFNDGKTPIEDLPSNGEELSQVGEEIPYKDDEAPSDLPSSNKVSQVGEEIPYKDDETPTDLPSSDKSVSPVGEETPYQDDEAPSDLPSSDKSVSPLGEEIPFNDEVTPSLDDVPSSENKLSTIGEETFFNDKVTSPAGDLPSNERRLTTTEPPYGRRLSSDLENSTSDRETRPETIEERNPLKIYSALSTANCGTRLVDRSSDVPVAGIRSIDQDSPQTTTVSPTGGGRRLIDTFKITIVGGARTNDKWSWMAGIFNRNNTTPFCGGSVIDTDHILTAAHCFNSKGLEPSQYIIKVGQIDLSEMNESYEIEEIKIHENYKPDFYYDDIALIRLKQKLPLKAYPVCIPEEDNLIQGDNVTVLGWGRLSFGGRSSRALQQADGIPIVKTEECNANYSGVSGDKFPLGITDNMICAGREEGGIDACSGDSGGPLLREFEQDRWALVGVISFGFGCAKAGFPGVYTRVANYLPWIIENVKI